MSANQEPWSEDGLVHVSDLAIQKWGWRRALPDGVGAALDDLDRGAAAGVSYVLAVDFLRHEAGSVMPRRLSFFC